MKIVDKDNNIVPRGIAGELCVRGYCNMLEYMDDPEKTKEIMDSSRWLRTGYDKLSLYQLTSTQRKFPYKH